MRGQKKHLDVNTHVGILLLGLDFGNSIDVILMVDLIGALTEGDHTRLDTDGLELGTTELVGAASQFGPVDGVVDGHLARVDLQDVGAGFLVGQRELDLAVETAGTQEGRVEDVDAVGGCKDLDAVVRGKAVELVEEFKHGALDFSVAGLFAVESLGSDGVEFVDEDD